MQPLGIGSQNFALARRCFVYNLLAFCAFLSLPSLILRANNRSRTGMARTEHMRENRLSQAREGDLDELYTVLGLDMHDCAISDSVRDSFGCVEVPETVGRFKV